MNFRAFYRVTLLACIGFIIPKTCFAVNIDVLKVSYVYKIIAFTQWPEESFNADHQAFNICVAWDNFIDEARLLLKEKHVKGRPIKIEKIKHSLDLSGCHIAFVSNTEKNYRKWQMLTDSTAPVLTISDREDFASNNGMIGLVIHENRLGFEINWTLIKSKQISVKSQLLDMAVKLY